MALKLDKEEFLKPNEPYTMTVDMLISKAGEIDYWNQPSYVQEEFAQEILEEYSFQNDFEPDDYTLDIYLPIGHWYNRRVCETIGVDELCECLDDPNLLHDKVTNKISNILAGVRGQLSTVDKELNGEQYYADMAQLYSEYEAKLNDIMRTALHDTH